MTPTRSVAGSSGASQDTTKPSPRPREVRVVSFDPEPTNVEAPTNVVRMPLPSDLDATLQSVQGQFREMLEAHPELWPILRGDERASAPAPSETFDEWFERYFAWKRTQPRHHSVRQDASKYSAWISPRLGKLRIAAPRAELAAAIEELRDDLDDAVREYNEHGKGKHKDKSRTSGANAAGIWGVLVTGLNYARSAKKRSGLRMRDDNPCDGIRAPDKSPKKYKTVLRPIEWVAVAACEDNDRTWRETWAVMLYTGLRPGEGRVLEWADVDFTTNMLRVCKAWDYEHAKVGPTKTHETRDVPIEPTLRPLLVGMHARARGERLVLPRLSSLADETAISKVFRRHLEAAGVERADLLPDEDPKKRTARVATRFRSLRDWYITWRLRRGDNPFVVQRCAGHQRFATTEKYIADVDKLSAACGEVFPALPSGLVGPEGSTEGAPEGTGNNGGCERRELKPPPPELERGELGARSGHAADDLARTMRLAAEAGRWDLVERLLGRRPC